MTKPSTDEGTHGELTGFDFEFYSGELPWRNNEPGRSCIPAGTYKCRWQESPRFGWCYEITGVPGRSRVLIHAGNYSGDKAKGKRSDVEGCVLLGKAMGVLNGQRAVLRSKEAIREFHERMAQQDFDLIVERQ